MSKTPLSLPGTLASFTETWSPRLVAAVNDTHVKVAKIDGAFIWHSHPNSDELFYLISGKLTLEVEGEGEAGDNQDNSNGAVPKVVDRVEMRVGDMYVVPRGIPHRPVAENAEIMMIEKEGTLNTGDAPVSTFTKQVQDARLEA